MRNLPLIPLPDTDASGPDSSRWARRAVVELLRPRAQTRQKRNLWSWLLKGVGAEPGVYGELLWAEAESNGGWSWIQAQGAESWAEEAPQEKETQKTTKKIAVKIKVKGNKKIKIGKVVGWLCLLFVVFLFVVPFPLTYYICYVQTPKT